jgi:hypothetical protein
MRNLIVIAAALAALVGAGLSYKIRSKQPVHPRIASQIHQQLQRECGAVEGRVINAYGDVVSGATVFAELDSTRSMGIQTTVSDKDGNFRIPIREMGNYTVSGSKEEDGYPLTVSGFHQQVSLDQIPKLTFTECKVVTDVVLQLGQRAPMIEGSVTDHVTGQRVKRATIILRRADNPEVLYQTSTNEANPGHFRLAVSTTPFTIEVESPEFEAWTYSNDRVDRSDPLTVARGQIKKLKIALRPKKQP